MELDNSASHSCSILIGQLKQIWHYSNHSFTVTAVRVFQRSSDHMETGLVLDCTFITNLLIVR